MACPHQLQHLLFQSFVPSTRDSTNSRVLLKQTKENNGQVNIGSLPLPTMSSPLFFRPVVYGSVDNLKRVRPTAISSTGRLCFALPSKSGEVISDRCLDTTTSSYLVQQPPMITSGRKKPRLRAQDSSWVRSP